jgi:hypothetical protein
MLLGTLISRLQDEDDAAAALAALDDIVLFAQVQAQAVRHDETPGEYTAGAVSRFANTASDEDWLALMTAIERSDDPARTSLERMVRWSLARDASPPDDHGATGHSGCTCA